MYNKNNNDPKLEPCGTPHLIGLNDEVKRHYNEPVEIYYSSIVLEPSQMFAAYTIML